MPALDRAYAFVLSDDVVQTALVGGKVGLDAALCLAAERRIGKRDGSHSVAASDDSGATTFAATGTSSEDPV
jgi:hypothetical protein